jgi:hypothetical protein
MWILSNDFRNGMPIPNRNAFCRIDPDVHATFSSNLNPHLAWGDVPDGTESFALLAIDVDVPSVGDDVNLEEREVPELLERTDFTHWAIVDIPGDVREIPSGEYSNGVTPRGKPGATGAPMEGLNDYTGWFSSDPEMAGTYRGYDGPCPPWNDSIVHRYVFTLSALDMGRLGLGADFTAAGVREAMTDHVLADAVLMGTYTLNPRLR